MGAFGREDPLSAELGGGESPSTEQHTPSEANPVSSAAGRIASVVVPLCSEGGLETTGGYRDRLTASEFSGNTPAE